MIIVFMITKIEAHGRGLGWDIESWGVIILTSVTNTAFCQL